MGVLLDERERGGEDGRGGSLERCANTMWIVYVGCGSASEHQRYIACPKRVA